MALGSWSVSLEDVSLSSLRVCWEWGLLVSLASSEFWGGSLSWGLSCGKVDSLQPGGIPALAQAQRILRSLGTHRRKGELFGTWATLTLA
jgi:hypothetical protein